MPNQNSEQSGERILTVTQLNQRVAQILANTVGTVQVVAEVSNFTRAASGHWYFSLKDERCAVRAVMFRGRTIALDFIPKDGEKYIFEARVGLYEPRGDYQLQIQRMRKVGQGDLHEAFVQLKNKLQAQGLFSPELKLPINPHPRRVGVITSLSAAALRDVMTAFARRAPHVELLVYPASVQGQSAAQEVRQALQTAIARNEVETLLIVRGGGSLEDLWPFNDEQLGREIVASPIPVISGVGHETDFTIADFVADLRAPTPTAAAELATPNYQELQMRLQQALAQLQHRHRRFLEHLQWRLEVTSDRLVSPQQRIRQQGHELYRYQRRMQAAMHRTWQQQQQVFGAVQRRLGQTLPDTRSGARRLQQAARALALGQQQQLQRQQHRYEKAADTLQALDPELVLKRGYAIVRDKHATVVKNALDLKQNERLSVQLAHGHLLVELKEKHDLL